MRHFKRLFLFLLVVFIVPALGHLAVWAASERPRSWNQADWSSAGTLSAPPAEGAEVLLMVARTGGIKGAFASHSWLLIKKDGQAQYDRYDVVGWGRPVRVNAYPPDGRWYSNDPVVHARATGEAAAAAIPKLEEAIGSYRFSRRGDYTIWPGPNSNTFVAQIIAAAPELGFSMPATAVGRDFPADGSFFDWAGDEVRLSLAGYAGFRFALAQGLELNFLGLVFGVDWSNGRFHIPAFGTLGRAI